jgi:hypothetical protein
VAIAAASFEEPGFSGITKTAVSIETSLSSLVVATVAESADGEVNDSLR